MKRILFFSLILCCASAFAEGGLYAPVKTHSKFYVGVLLGASDLHYKADDFNAGAGSVDDVGLAGRAFVGYKLWSYFGVEVGYEHYQDAEFDNFSGVSGSDDLQQAAMTYQLRFSFPIKQFELYAKAGGATVFRSDLSTFHNSDQKTTVMLGLGAGWFLTPNWQLNTEYSYAAGAGSLPRMDLYAGGVSYHFDAI